MASEIVSGRDVEVECSNPDKLVITDGQVDGEYTVAHSCAAPNLVVGNCYSGGIGGYTYAPTCSRSDAKIDRHAGSTYCFAPVS
ncbi:hypothetical protein [Nocardia sp. NPDC004415]